MKDIHVITTEESNQQTFDCKKEPVKCRLQFCFKNTETINYKPNQLQFILQQIHFFKDTNCRMITICFSFFLSSQESMVDYLSGRTPSGNFLSDIRPGFFGKAFSKTAVTSYVKEDSEYIEIELQYRLTV